MFPSKENPTISLVMPLYQMKNRFDARKIGIKFFQVVL